MEIIKLNLMNTGYIDYIPLFIYKNHIYLVKQSFEQDLSKSEKDKSDTIYDGFFRYSLLNNSLEPIYTSKKITNYFFNKDDFELYYVSIDERNEEYYAHIFKLDIYNGVEEKQFCVKLQSYVEDDSIFDINTKIGYLDVISQFIPFQLNENYIGYKIDKINTYDKYYNHLEDSNEFRLFIYDKIEGKGYEILDKTFCKHGFEQIKVFKIHNKEYILFNAGIYEEQDKYEYMYNSNTKYISTIRGFLDTIYLIPLQTFINDIKRGSENISYKKIEVIGQEGTVRFINIYDSKIYYKVTHFDKGFSELVIYDINTNIYQRKKIDSLNNLIGITLNGDIGYIFSNKLECIIELSGEKWESRRKVRITGRFIDVLESKYLITEDTEISNNKLVYYCNIYDINSLDLVNRFQGQPFTFKEENMIIIC